MLQTYVCQTVDDTKVVDLLSRGVVFMSSPETAIIGVEVEVPVRVFQLIRHLAGGLTHWYWLLGLDHLPQFPCFPSTL